MEVKSTQTNVTPKMGFTERSKIHRNSAKENIQQYTKNEAVKQDIFWS